MDEVLFSNPKQLKMSDKEYELAMAITHLIKAAEKIGLTEDTKLEGTEQTSSRVNVHILRYAFEIYKVWAALFPLEHREFITNTEYELDVERPVKQAISAGGYTPISFPTRLDRLFNLMMPGVKTQDKRFWKPLLSYIPELRRSNYA